MEAKVPACTQLTQGAKFNLTATAILFTHPDGGDRQGILRAGQQTIQDNGLAAAGDILYNSVT